MKNLVGVEDVAKHLGIKIDTVYKWASSGYLPHVSLGRGSKRKILRFDLDEVQRWIKSQRRQGEIRS